MIGVFSVGLGRKPGLWHCELWHPRGRSYEEGSPYIGQAPWIRHQKVCSLMLSSEVKPRL